MKYTTIIATLPALQDHFVHVLAVLFFIRIKLYEYQQIPMPEGKKKAVEHHSNWYVCTKIGRNWSVFFFRSFFLFFSSVLSSGFLMFSRDLVSSHLPVIFPGHWPWMYSPPLVDIFWTSHARIIYSLVLLSKYIFQSWTNVWN